MIKHGKRVAALMLALAMAAGGSISASAANVIVSGQGQDSKAASTSGVIVAGQGQSQGQGAGGPGGGQTAVPGQSGFVPAAPAEYAPVVNELPNAVTVVPTYGSYGQLQKVAMSLNGLSGSISYGIHVNFGGAQAWAGDGHSVGTTDVEHIWIEAIQIAISGEIAKSYDVYYRGTSAIAGQHGWAAAEQLMGTIGRGDYLTGLQVVLVPKGSGYPGSYEGRFYSSHSGSIHVEMGNTTYANGYTGWVDHDMARYYFVNGRAVTGWQYIDGLKFYFNEGGALIMDVDNIIGKQPSYQLRVNKQLNCLTVYAKDGANGYIIPVKSMLTSVGDNTPIGTFRTPEKYRWRLMVNDTYTQYATRLTAGKGFLFHSITYDAQRPDALIPNGYNYLGVNRSLGCIRLTCGNAKWVYENCPLGTEVVVYNDPNSPGPFFKPYQVWIPLSQTWDPTDPAMAGR